MMHGVKNNLDIWPRGKVGRSGVDIYPVSVLSRQEIDLRSELRDMLHGTYNSPQRGHWVLLRRADTSQRCTCWNEVGSGEDKYDIDYRKYNEAKEDCDLCDGTGYIYHDELHLTRKMIASPDIGLSRQEQTTPVGIMNVHNVAYYFKHDVVPTAKDKIIDIENTEQGKPKRPFNILKIHNISTSDSLRDIRGRIEFWKCLVKQEVI